MKRNVQVLLVPNTSRLIVITPIASLTIILIDRVRI